MSKTHHHARHVHRLALVRLRERELDREIEEGQVSGHGDNRGRVAGGDKKRPETLDLEGVPCACTPAGEVLGGYSGLDSQNPSWLAIGQSARSPF
jgi:hypothetical protein